MTFEEYLTKRRVNVAAFAAAEPQRFAEWQSWYLQMHPESFYMLVKMVLNDVRRNYWLAEVPKSAPVATANTEAAAPAKPAGRRAAMARPVTKSETSETAPNPEPAIQPVADAPEAKLSEAALSEESTSTKPARPVFKPRGVIKKPTPTSENQEIERVPEEKSAEIKPAETAPEDSGLKSAAENQEASTAKPARPRPVIKRPAALTSSEPKPAETSETKTPETTETVGEATEKVKTEATADTPKSPRPRPVFKRPGTAAPTVSEDTKTVGQLSEKPETVAEIPTENPVAKPGQEGASEAKAVAEEIQQNPEAAKAAEEVAAEVGHVPKPPRPRPIFKKPASTVNISESEAANPPIEEAKTVGEIPPKPEENPPEISAEKPAETVGGSAEKLPEPAPKPPRPRPIFKRPAKPEDDNKDPQ